MRFASLAALALLAAGCGAPAPSREWAGVREVTPEFLGTLKAKHAALASDAHGRVALTFVAREGAGDNLYLALSGDSGLTFGAPLRVNEREGRVMSLSVARPIAAFGADGRLAIAWTEKRAGDNPMAADLMVRSSGDGGATLGAIVCVNDDSASAHGRYHGFSTLAFAADGALFAAWMDPRDDPPGEGEPSSSSLYGAVSRDGGQHWSRNVRLTDRLCPCCRSAIAAPSAGTIAIAYRAAVPDPTWRQWRPRGTPLPLPSRDPALLVSSDGGTTFALDTLLSADGWKLGGCPAAALALTANGDGGGTIAWYTEGGAPTVYVAPWQDTHGLSGVKRAMSDSLHEAREPRLAALAGATLLAVEARPAADTTRRVLAVRALEADGALTPWMFLGAGAENGWIAGAGARSALALWSERSPEGSRVRIVRLERR